MTGSTTKKIEDCPYCGFPCKEGRFFGRLFVVACTRRFNAGEYDPIFACSYSGPARATAEEALQAHSSVFERLRGKKRVSEGDAVEGVGMACACDTCRVMRRLSREANHEQT